MKTLLLYTLSAGLAAIMACSNQGKTTSKNSVSHAQGTYGYDVAFLQQYDSVILLKDEESQVVVSPKYQAKVFTSTADGANGKSFGWVNYKAFTALPDAHMNAYGGENRFWLGPEGGPYSLYFSKGKEMVFENWKTPPPIDTEAWAVVNKSAQSVQLQKSMTLTNYAGTEMQLLADRTVTILQRNEIAGKTGLSLSNPVKAVGYRTDNKITNTGQQSWNEKTGAPCIWMLDMFTPSPSTVIVIPYKKEGTGKVATTDYFGEIASDRMKYKDSILLFRADGKSRGKLGLGPARAKPVAGSYDAQNGVLTIALFDVDASARYLNQEWSVTKPPFSGDAVNAYNDGPLQNGSQLGPFYEIESVSPAAFLNPGASLTHQHTVLHFTGSEQALEPIARQLLGISLAEVRAAF
jgi:hypothetical protein